MITFIKGSDNHLRALVTNSAGVLVNDATVKATIKETYGAALAGLDNVDMPYVAGQTTYNYELVVEPAQIANAPLGIRYTAIVVAERATSIRSKTETLEITE